MSIFWLGVLYLHLLAMATFVGGQVLLAAAVVPVKRRSPDPEWMRSIARRFGVVSAGALVILLGTGAMMASEYGLWDTGKLQLKLGLIAAVLVLTALHVRHPRAHALSALIFVLTLVIVWLGADLAN